VERGIKSAPREQFPVAAGLDDPALVEEAGIAYYGIGRGRSVVGRGHE